MCSTTMQVSAKSDCPFPNFAFKYLREDEKFRETVFACSYGAQVESFKPRKWSKILWHCPCMWFITVVAWSDLQFCPTFTNIFITRVPFTLSLCVHFILWKTRFLLHQIGVNCWVEEVEFCFRHNSGSIIWLSNWNDLCGWYSNNDDDDEDIL